MKIAFGQISHETNTFSDVKTDISLFKESEWKHGEDIIYGHKGIRDYLGGMIKEGENLNINLAPTFSASYSPSGMITDSAFIALKNELTSSLKSIENIDAVCLALHGGGVTEKHNDLEGEILKAVRQVIGYEIPLVCSLDLHGNLTETMVNESNALLGVNHYPHTDAYERGMESIKTAYKIVKKEITPVISFKKLSLMIYPSTSYQSPVKDINELCWKEEGKEEVIDCTFFHGFARADTEITGASIITITNNNLQLGNEINSYIAQEIWERKEEFIHDYPSPINGIEEALAIEHGPVVINETSDNPGSGAPGDGTYLLRALLQKNISKTCFGFIADPEVTKLAHATGVGKNITVSIGGKTDNHHGSPLEVKAYIKNLTDGQFIQSSPMYQGTRVNLGKSVLLQIGNVDVIVCSKKSQTMDEQIFVLHGIEFNKYKILALKSCQHFRAAFQTIAQKIITVDSPGISTSNKDFYDYKNVPRPIFPLDIDFEYTK